MDLSYALGILAKKVLGLCITSIKHVTSMWSDTSSFLQIISTWSLNQQDAASS